MQNNRATLMNEDDINNLKFIMNATQEELAVWWNTLSDDDKAYAEELLNWATTTLKSSELSEIFFGKRSVDDFIHGMSSYDNDLDLTLANKVLSKFML